MAEKTNIIDTDILIIGSGIGGLSAALEAAKNNLRALVVSKSSAGKANNTILAGGLFTFATETFNKDKHLRKTLDAGRMINKPSLVEHFVENSPALVNDLIGMGLNGYFHESGYHCRTTGFLGGPHLSKVLVDACRGAGVDFLDNVMITDLTIIDGECHGAAGFHKRTGEIFGIRSGSSVLAMGGAGGIYAQTDNAPGATGDGYALGLDANLELMDMEFVQFYPLVYAGSGHAHMILPAFFADFGKITNRQGEDIKEKYGLREKPVAIVSRDRLSQALYREVADGNGFDGAIQLDLRNVDIKQIPGGNLIESTLKKKISYDSHPVRIVPACHHTMGGIVTDEYGHTELKHLYAVGEVAGGIHGANRMGGNALCEALVFGKTAVESAAANRPTERRDSTYETRLSDIVRKRFRFEEPAVGEASAVSMMKTLKSVVWECAGIIRSKDSLRKGITEIDGILEILKERRASSAGELKRLLECRNAALSAKAIAISALERTESRGSHYREDFTEEDTNWCKHIHVKMRDETPSVNRISGI